MERPPPVVEAPKEEDPEEAVAQLAQLLPDIGPECRPKPDSRPPDSRHRPEVGAEAIKEGPKREGEKN